MARPRSYSRSATNANQLAGRGNGLRGALRAVACRYYGENTAAAATRLLLGSDAAGSSAAEKLNTRSATPTSQTSQLSFDPAGTSIAAGLADFSHASWLPSRWYYGTNLAGSDTVCVAWWPSSTSLRSVSLVFQDSIEAAAPQRLNRRSRNGGFFRYGNEIHHHQKTGGGAFSQICPHFDNDITWVDTWRWRLGHAQADIWPILFRQGYDQTKPSVVLNTADGATLSTTPTLEFTGTDVESDDVRYEVQVATDDLFTSDAVLDSYSEANRDAFINLSGAAGDLKAAGQAFASGGGGTLTKAKFHLKKIGSPTGNAVAKLYAVTGAFGTDALPTGSALATSDTLDVSTLATSYALIDFDFTGGNQYALAGSTNYFISVEYSGGNFANYIEVGNDVSSPTHAGNGGSRDTAGIWAQLSPNGDVIFYVYTVPSVILGRVSGTDAGFANTVNGGDTDPFTSGQKVGFTVQAGDALAAGTYYWRVRAHDPLGSSLVLGSDNWSAWTTARSFTAASGDTTPPSISQYLLGR
jgi:hypothetical protein